MTICRFFDKNFVILDIVFIQFRLVMPTGKTVFSPKFYHTGLKLMHKSTPAEFNEKKDWQIYLDFAHVLFAWAQRLYKGDYFRLGLDESDQRIRLMGPIVYPY